MTKRAVTKRATREHWAERLEKIEAEARQQGDKKLAETIGEMRSRHLTTIRAMQSLGGTYTLQVPAYGGLFRVDGKDADAIGKEVTAAPAASAEGGGDIEHQVWEQLKTCYDPEIPVNIVDLGLVYDLDITSESDGRSRVKVNMTLTAQGCGMGGAIAGDARQKLLMLPGVSDADVQIVWDPPWNPQMISPEGKKHMGMA